MSAPDDIFVVVNPASGKGRGGRLVQPVLEALDSDGKQRPKFALQRLRILVVCLLQLRRCRIVAGIDRLLGEIHALAVGLLQGGHDIALRGPRHLRQEGLERWTGTDWYLYPWQPIYYCLNTDGGWKNWGSDLPRGRYRMVVLDPRSADGQVSVRFVTVKY